MDGARLSQRFLVPTLTCAIGACLGVSSASGNSPTHSPYRNLSVFARALAHLELSYVDPIDQDALVQGAIEGMAASLDPHSAYLPAERYKRLMEDTEGEYGGIGVEILARDGWLTVTSVFEGSPAAEVGLVRGDRILSIDGVPARDMRMVDALDRVRGRVGTPVELGVLRHEGTKRARLTKQITRQVINIDVVTVSSRDSLTIIRVAAFAEQTSDLLEDALKQAESDDSARAVVIDLRGNAGGLLNQAARAADLLLSEGTIVSTRGRGDVVLARYEADSHHFNIKKPIFVWVDAFTASAAEILAAALQESRVALLVGQQTWGKGSVQNIVELPDGSALKITVARYFTGMGRSIQASGIAPDVALPALEDAPSERTLPHHLAQGSGQREKLPKSVIATWDDHRRSLAHGQRQACARDGVDHEACTLKILTALTQPEAP